jgi:hypothetical protein
VKHRKQAVAYVRARSVHRNFGRQLEASGDVGWVFEERASGGSRAVRVALHDYMRREEQLRRAQRSRLLSTRGRPPAVTCPSRHRNGTGPLAATGVVIGDSAQRRGGLDGRSSSVSSDSAGLLD